MEIFLNLIWISLAAVIVWQWKRYAPPERASRWMQVAAVAMLILLLFPVISVSDDLQAAQYPAEDDSYLRWDHTAVNSHSIYSAIASLPPDIFEGLPFGFLRHIAPALLSAPAVDVPALTSIQNRPPPEA